MKEPYSILHLLNELESFQTIDPKILTRAERSNITDKNHKMFKELLHKWVEGWYDEDVPILVNDLNNLMEQRL